MNDKTYRVSAKTAEKVRLRNIEYIKKHGVILAEAKMINALIEIGLKRERENDVELWVSDNK